MNQFKSGTLLVIAATVITAILMLTTNRETSSQSKINNEATTDTAKTEVEEKTKTTTTEVVSEGIASTETTEVKTGSIEKQDVQEKVTASEAEKVTLITQEPQEIAAPEGPYSKSEDETETDKATESNTEVPTTVIAESTVADNVKQTNESSIQVESINVVATSNQHDLLNHLVQPIWMDQKLGDFKSIENGDVVFKMMPSTPNGLQGEDPQQVVTNKSDKFAPTTVSADYNYQQMPMYNGGYFIAPMPPYLMESMLPISEPVKAQ